MITKTKSTVLPNSLAEHLGRPYQRPDKPKGLGACPTYFVANCLEASRGGSAGYKFVGRQLVSGIANLAPDWLDNDQRAAELEILQDLILNRQDRKILDWFQQHVPRCMKLIPARRREALLDGVYEYVIDDENDITA
jgi:hypothetical protein